MIRSRFQDLRRKKEYEEKRDLVLKTIAEETGLSYGAIQRISSGNMERIYLSTLDTLCKYFNVSSVSDLIEYESQDPSQAPGMDEKPSAT
jgi:putative transcriptional regulator